MIRPPTGGTNNTGQGSKTGEASSSLGNKDSLRPPSGQPLNQIEELHKNNRLKRPDTSNNRKNDEDQMLDMLNNSQGVGSHTSGTRANI